MRVSSWLCGTAVTGAALLFAGAAFADGVYTATLCTEAAAGGCVQVLPVGGTTITAASDGESAFDPFGAGYDTSDGIQFDNLWTAVKTNGWNQLAGSNTWVLPACDAGGTCENGNVSEPVGVWEAVGQTLSVPKAVFNIYEADGSLSDVITLYNGNGGVFLTFDSSVPEPASWALMLGGLAALGGALRRRPAVAAA